MASEYAISKQTLTGIADAIREKTETTGTMTPGQMPSKIRSINGGGSGGVQSVEVTQIQSTGTKIASIDVDGTSTDLYAPNGGGGGSTVSVTQVLSSGTKAATITVDGVGTDIYAPTQPDVTGKADKVANATSGHFAALDSNGNLTDSGHQHSDYLTQHQDISGKLDAPSTAGTSGQVLKLDSNLNTTWATVGDGVTVSGTTATVTDLNGFDPLPSGGTAGDVLEMGANGPEWSDSVTELKSAVNGKQAAPATAGTAGQVLSLNSSLAPVWADATQAPTVTVVTPASGSTFTLQPCPVTYNFGEKAELTVTVTATSQYHFAFSCPSSAATVLTITGETMRCGDTLEAGKTYEVDIWAGITRVSVVDGVAVT